MLADTEMCLNNSQYKIFIIEIKQEVCGFIGLFSAKWLYNVGSLAKVLALVVDEQQRGLKICRQLLTLRKIMLKLKVVIK